MLALHTYSLALVGLALLAQPAAAQTAPTTHLPTHRVQRMPAAHATDPLRGTNGSGRGTNVYAAPGEPVNMADNGKNTPSYDGPAPKPASRTKTTLATPK